jgi:hypothetical protein
MQALQAPTIRSSKDELFKDLETFCMFIGFPRSGHTLTGFLLDAHPNMIVARELHVLKHIYAGFSESQIYHLLVENSRARAEASSGKHKYSYAVPNQWQGSFQKLQVIGDKQGGASTRHLDKHPDSLQRLSQTISLKIKFINVLRNPYDNISSMAARKNWSLEESTERYFSLCERIENIKKQIATSDLFELRHESFIDNPQGLLKELCNFLGVEATDDYLNDCARIVYKAPHKSRDSAGWDHKLIPIVEDRIAEFTFLKGYSFEN